MMENLAFASIEDAQEAAKEIKAMGGSARKLLAECVEHQELRRAKVSPTAQRLANGGFIVIRELGRPYSTEVLYAPTLAGEEALEQLEDLGA